MILKAHNLISNTGNDTIQFVVWSRQGPGMVNVGNPGACGDILSIEAARKYWKEMVAKYGYQHGPITTVQPY